MLVGIDANEANIANRVGSNEFAWQVLWQLYRLDKTNQYLIYLKNPAVKDLPLARKNWQYIILTPAFLWTQWRLPWSLWFDRPRPNIFLTLGHYAPRWAPMPTMVCIMDLAFLKFPETFKKLDLWQLTNWTRYSVKKASDIFAISEATKKDIMVAYGAPEKKISVVYPGVDKLPVTGKSPVKGKYILYVGTLQPRKNIDALIEAFSQLSHPGVEISFTPGWKLVIAGKIGWKYQIKPAANVRYLGYVPKEKLGALMKNSQGLVLPSLYEGFGIPVAQAMSLGVPVLVSRNSSLPEIVGDCGLYIEPPFDVSAICVGLDKLISQSFAEKKELITCARLRAQQFSWPKTVQVILDQFNLRRLSS